MCDNNNNPTYTLISDTIETLHCTKYTCYYTTPLDDDPMEVWVSGVWPLALAVVGGFSRGLECCCRDCNSEDS